MKINKNWHLDIVDDEQRLFYYMQMVNEYFQCFSQGSAPEGYERELLL